MGYLLHPDIVFDSIRGYLHDNPGKASKLIEEKPEKEYHLRVSDTEDNLDKKKKFGILKIFFAKGHTSFDIQGNPGFSNYLKGCQDHIIATSQLTDIQKENKYATFRNVPSSKYQDFVDYLTTEPTLAVQHSPGDSKVSDHMDVKGPYDTHVSITYYKTGTVMIQGLITSLLIDLYNTAVELLGPSDTGEKGGFLAIIKSPGVEVISENLDDHFTDRSKFNDTPFEDLIMTSLKLLNSSISLPDFSAMSFGALKALEGMIGTRLNMDIELGNRDAIGSRFQPDTAAPNHWILTNTNLTSAPLVRTLEDSYSHYNAYRNTTFHIKPKDPMASIRFATKDQALGVVEEALKLMNRIIRNW